MSVLDTIREWLTGSPGEPRFASPLVNVSVEQDFVQSGTVHGFVKVEPLANGSVAAWANGRLRYVPAQGLATPFPDLRKMDGEPYEPQEGDLLYEVWPQAFRRLETMFAGIEGPNQPDLEKPVPQMPLPRWMVIGNAQKPVVAARADALAQLIFGATPIDLTPFFEGKIPLYIPAAAAIHDVPQVVDVYAFDANGLAVDPVVFTCVLGQLADSVFSSFRNGPDIFTLPPVEPRQVYVFSDHHGRPYQPYSVPGTPAPSQPTVTIQQGFNLQLFGGQLPLNGVIVVPSSSIDPGLITIGVEGQHLRTGLHPHGMLEKDSVKTWLEPWAFRRIRAIDLDQWFPPQTALSKFQRYTEKNEIIPLADGHEAFRAMYRAYRETYRDETYDSDEHIPAGTPLDGTGSQIFFTNLLVTPDSPFFGRRAMHDAPRTQEEEVVANPLENAVMIPMATSDAEQRRVWLVGKLPPGACIELQPLAMGADFTADDPRIPGNDRGAVLYGITVTDVREVVSVFANANGDFFLPVHFVTDVLEAEVRVTTWKAEAGQEVKQVHAFPFKREVHNFPAPPEGGWSWPQEFTLKNNGAGNGATLVIHGGGPTAAGASIVVITQRSGAIVEQTKSAQGDTLVALPDFGSKDVALAGVLPSAGSSPSLCGKFFAVTPTAEQLTSGFIPAHPRQLLGVLRQAIDAGVEVRHLAYRDQLKGPTDDVGANPDAAEESPGGTAALVNALNAVILDADNVGRRGEAISDPLLRPTSSHHQKMSFIRSPKGVSALVGGVDHLPSRYAGTTHDEVDPDRPTKVLWHDGHCYIRGRAAWDVYRNFQQRWNAASVAEKVIGEGVQYTPVDGEPDMNLASETGTHAVQIARTLPPGNQDYDDFMNPETGELTILASYERTIDNARRFLYIEDQYFWNVDLAQRINERLRTDGAHPLAFVILVLPKQLAEFPVVDLILYAMRRRATNMLLYGQVDIPEGTDLSALPANVSDRVLIVHPVNDQERPIYVHSKMIMADDLFLSIGSSNINNRSMTYDTELNVASIDFRMRRGAHQTAHDMRVRLMAEHLGLDEMEKAMIEDPMEAYRLFRAAVSDAPPDWLDERKSRRQHLVPFSSSHTHYGPAPTEYNQFFLTAVQMFLDPIGTDMKATVHFQELLGFLKAMSAAAENSNAVFGGLGALRATFFFPGAMIVDSVMLEITTNADAPQDPPNVVIAGPFAPDQPASVGIFSAGAALLITGKAFLGQTQVGNTVPPVMVQQSGFVTDVSISFVPS